MNVTHIKNYDAINELPSDENPVSENEMKIVNMLFKEKEKPKLKTSSKDIFEIVVVGFLFVLVSLPCFDCLFQIESNNIIILLIKTFLIMFLFGIIRYVELKKFFM
jgi:hypothetical protein